MQADQHTVDTEEDSVIMRSDNRNRASLYTSYSQSGQTNEEQEVNRRQHKEPDFTFMLDLKIPTSKTAIDPEMTIVRAEQNAERDTAPEGYRPGFDELSIRWGLVFVEYQIAVLIDLRKD